MPAHDSAARRYLVRGRVQGVGFRNFAQRAARRLGLTGYTRNLDNGQVEVYACGLKAKLDELGAELRAGPTWADVRGVEEVEAPVLEYDSFQIRH